jgi:hypothetical protein
MKNHIKAQYEGMGFVEALIAIMVVGASSVVLMQIASRTLQEMIQNETIDTMTQYAVEGATMVQNVAMQEKITGDDVFPNPGGSANNCYAIDLNSEDKYVFRETEQGYTMYNLTEERNIYKEEAIVQEDADNLFFRIFCIESYDPGDRYVVVKVVVGQSNTEAVDGGSATKGSNVKDYIYFTVVNL